jgi:hypothetical protein
MAFRQYTSCVQPINFISANVVGYTYLLTVLGLIVAAFAASYSVYTLPILIGLLIALITFLVWWLYDRLICLGGLQCAIGVVRNTNRGNIPDITKAGDDDFTINLFLAGGPTDIKKSKQEFWAGPLGKYVAENASILQIGLHYAQDGSDLDHMKTLHCEFEGSGIRDLLIWANVVLALLIAALAVLLAAGPIGAIISVILWILASLATAAALGIAIFHPLAPGDPADINPNLGDLGEGDLVIIKGDWIYDSLHVGWNEFHAVHDCQIIQRNVDLANGWPADIGMGLGLDTAPKVQAAVDFWCNSLDQATIAQVNGNRDDPSQNWVIHPAIDGCTKLV